MAQKRQKISAEIILATALDRAEIDGWQNTSLHDLADDLGITLSVIKDHYCDLDAIANAWFQRSLKAMLAPTELGFCDLPPRERLFQIMMCWLDAMATHKNVTMQMIRVKLYLGHPHHWAPLIFNLSRLVHWIREAAFLHAQGRQRQLEEVGLTCLVVKIFRFWGNDQSEDQIQTRQFLSEQLEVCDRIMLRLCR